MVTEPSRVRRRLQGVVIAVVVVGMLGAAGWSLWRMGHPGGPSDDARDLTAALLRIDGVVDAQVSSPDAVGTESSPTATPWRDVSVQTQASTGDGFVAVGRAVVEVLDQQEDADRLVAEVWRTDAGTSPDIRVQVAPAADADGSLLDAVALADAPGVTGVQVRDDGVGVNVDDPAQLAGVVAVADRRRIGLTQLSTTDQRVTTAVAAGQLDAAVVNLLAEVDSWSGVTGVTLVDNGDADDVSLDVQVTGDNTVADVAAALEASTTLQGRTTPVQFGVSSSFRALGGVVGQPSSPAPDPQPAAPAADGQPAWPTDPTAPDCAGDDLTVRIAGIDAAAGSRMMLLTATNDGGRPCAVDGRPAPSFRRISGTLVPDVELGSPSTSPEPARLVVPVGGTVAAALTWHGMSVSQDPDATVAVLVVPVPGAPTVELPVGDRGPLDILEGAAVSVSPWQQSIEGWTVP